MSPLPKPPPFSGRTLVIAGIAIVIGIALLWVASAALTSRHNARLSGVATGGVVDLGDASSLAAQIQRADGAPIYLPDVSGNDQRAVYLSHQGPRSDQGWTAFRAQVPGQDSSCQWEWNTATGGFDASCDENRHTDAQGTGLEHYPVSVQDGKLRLDLRLDAPTTPTDGSSAPEPATSSSG